GRPRSGPLAAAPGRPPLRRPAGPPALVRVRAAARPPASSAPRRRPSRRPGMGPGMWMALLALLGVMGIGARLTLQYSDQAVQQPTRQTPAASAPTASAAPPAPAAERGGVTVSGGAARLSPS